MPAGSKIRGIDGVIELTSGATTEEIPCLTSWTLETSASINEDDTICMLSNGDGGTGSSSNWSTSDVGAKSFTISTEHFWQEDQTAGTTSIADATNVGDEVDFKLFPNTNATGKIQYSGKAIIESVSIPSEANGKITQSITLRGTGALSKVILP